MPRISLTHSRYKYVHDNQEGHSQPIDVHEVFVRKCKERNVVLCIIVLLLLANTYYLLLVKGKPGIGFFWSILLFLFPIYLSRKSVKKESVIVMPAFGVQLETHYWSGKIIHRFVPIGKILKPVLNECVTPVTCYWSLALIVRGEEDLMLVFQELRPPVSMLVPVWKALCTATNGLETEDAEADH